MGKEHARNITAADRAAADRLKALWLALPRDQRPTQQAMADAWTGDGDANQSLISQYLNGRIALNYLAVQFFARQVGCSASAIRDDLPEQRLTGSVIAPAGSQAARPDPSILAQTQEFLETAYAFQGKSFDLRADAELFADAYEWLAEDERPVDQRNLVHFGRWLARRQQANEVADEDESGSVAGKVAGTNRGRAARTA